MAQLVRSERKIGLKTSPDKVYNFLKNNITSFAQMCPSHLKIVQIAEGGTQLRPGCTLHVKYSFDGRNFLTIKAKVQSVDDARRTVSFVMVEGETLKLYKSLKAKFEVGSDHIKWSVEVEKANPNAPHPEAYMDIANMVTKATDVYLFK